jgi:hypothetical protein
MHVIQAAMPRAALARVMRARATFARVMRVRVTLARAALAALLLAGAPASAAPQVATGGFLPNPAPGDRAARVAPERPALYVARTWHDAASGWTARVDYWPGRLGAGVAGRRTQRDDGRAAVYGADVALLGEIVSAGTSLMQPAVQVQATLSTAFGDDGVEWSVPLHAGVALHAPFPVAGVHLLTSPWLSGYAVVHGRGAHLPGGFGAGAGLRVILSDGAGVLTKSGVSGYARLGAGADDGAARLEIAVLRLLK